VKGLQPCRIASGWFTYADDPNHCELAYALGDLVNTHGATPDPDDMLETPHGVARCELVDPSVPYVRCRPGGGGLIGMLLTEHLSAHVQE